MGESIEDIADLIMVNAARPEYVNANLAKLLAIEAVDQYRAQAMGNEAEEYVANLPVRKPVESGDGGGRFYWRLCYGGGFTTPACKSSEKSAGTLQKARNEAVREYLKGRKVLEIIPPDIDPESERTRNVSKPQPDGLTVRQREKRH